SREQMETIAGRLAKRGVRVLRGGAFRTSDDPYGFQGLGEEGLKLLREVADRHRMLTHSTIFDAAQLPLFARYVDIIQVSERDMRNYVLLKELAKLGKPVMLRRGASSTIEETLMAADDVMRCGRGTGRRGGVAVGDVRARRTSGLETPPPATRAPFRRPG